MNITAEQAAEINGRLSCREFILEYLRRPAKTLTSSTKDGNMTVARGVPYGILIATMVKGKIFITGSRCRKTDKFDPLEAKRIALERMDKVTTRYLDADNTFVQPPLSASLEDAAFRFAERAVTYFKGGSLIRPEFKYFEPTDIKKMLKQHYGVEAGVEVESTQVS